MRFTGAGSVLLPDSEWLKKKPNHKAILVKGGKTVAYGESTLGGCGKFTKRDCRTCHAEINCLKALPRKFYRKPNKLSGLVLWSVRWRQDGTPANALPCAYCRTSLVRLGITACMYTDDDGQILRCDLRTTDNYISSGELGNHSKTRRYT